MSVDAGSFALDEILPLFKRELNSTKGFRQLTSTISLDARSVILNSSFLGIPLRTAIFFMTVSRCSADRWASGGGDSSPLPILEYCNASMVMSLYSSIVWKIL